MLNLITIRSFVLLILFTMSVAAVDSDYTWKRLFSEDKDLIGVRIQQNPDNGDRESYLHKHPAMVIYVFSTGDGFKVFQAGFTPTGNLNEAFWWEDKAAKLIDSKIIAGLTEARHGKDHK